MQSKLVFIIFFTFSFTMEWIDYNGYKINSKIVVIKIKKEIAPLLGLEEPIKINDESDINNALIKIGAVDINPLFIHYNSFGENHYNFELHQYYKISFRESINFNQIEKTLYTNSSIELVEPSYMKEM